MSDLLQPDEVNALLAAVASGDVKLPDGSARPDQPVTPYDFTRPERVNKDQLRAITSLHERFARGFSGVLAGLLRTVVEVNVSSVEQLNYSEFIASLPNPTALAVIPASALPASFVLEMHPDIALHLIDRMLGGTQEQATVPDRPLTDIEQRLFRRLIAHSLPPLEETWANLQRTTFSVTEVATNPQLLLVAAPHEAVVVVSFEITLGSGSGTMSLCMPHSALEPIMALLATRNWFVSGRRDFDEAMVCRMTRALSGATVELVAHLAETSITVRELHDLQVGDVIKTSLPVDGEITLCVDGKPKFKGHPGRVRRNKAVQISRRIAPDCPD